MLYAQLSAYVYGSPSQHHMSSEICEKATYNDKIRRVFLCEYGAFASTMEMLRNMYFGTGNQEDPVPPTEGL